MTKANTLGVAIMLDGAMRLLQQEFPGEALYEVRYEVRMGEREDHPGLVGLERNWSDVTWTLQVNNDRDSGKSPEECCAELRKRRMRKQEVPDRAERIANILREVPDERFDREDVIGAARKILEDERRSKL